jgi:hypothetical protein
MIFSDNIANSPQTGLPYSQGLVAESFTILLTASRAEHQDLAI